MVGHDHTFYEAVGGWQNERRVVGAWEKYIHRHCQNCIVPRDFLKFGDNAVMWCGDVVILVGLGQVGSLGSLGDVNGIAAQSIQIQSNKRHTFAKSRKR